MSRITVTIEVEDEYFDSEHETGLTNEGYEALVDAVGSVGSVQDVQRA